MFRKLLFLFLILVPLSTAIATETDNIYHEKGIVREVKNETALDGKLLQSATIEVLSGPDQGQYIDIKNTFSGGFREVRIQNNDKVLLYVEATENGPIFSIRDFWRSDGLIFWILFFILMTWAVARFKGIKGILALAISILLIFFFFVPAIISGGDPMLHTLSVSVFIIIINVPLIHGWNKKSLVISISTACAVIISIGLTLIMDYFLHIRGNGADEAIYLPSKLQAYDYLPKLFAAGVIIGALGAIMDICVSIASGLYEVVRHKKTSFQKLFISGMNIGGDVLGSMLNTLVFAYVGASLIMILVIAQGDFDLISLLNFSFINEEVVRSLIGAFGLLFAIPITTAVSSFLFQSKEEPSV